MGRRDTDPNRGNRAIPLSYVSAADLLDPQCWAMADDENPDCPIGSARCARHDGHDGDHVWEARP